MSKQIKAISLPLIHMLARDMDYPNFLDHVNHILLKKSLTEYVSEKECMPVVINLKDIETNKS